jgi:NitT/TauT family transport system substrate-binding protein
LKRAGLAPDEVVKVRVTGDHQLRAYQAGEVDALVSWEPIATRLEAMGARRLFDNGVSRTDCGRAGGAHGRLERLPESFQNCWRAIQALDYLHEHPTRPSSAWLRAWA